VNITVVKWIATNTPIF